MSSFAEQKVVLIALLGTSPAVLTEMVWALATREEEPIVPDEIELWTTTKGKDAFEKQVLNQGVWEKLKADLVHRGVQGVERLRIGPASFAPFVGKDYDYLEDLSSEETNLLAADKMLKELRKYTDDPSCRVILSIAGGRKTMGALALQCISLVGRECDEVYHILVNEPFDKRLDPLFFYPEQVDGVWEKRKYGDKIYTDDQAELYLFKVPYVRMRPLYEEKLGESISTFTKLSARIQQKIDRKPVLKMNKKTGKVWLDKHLIKLSAIEFYILCLVLKKYPYGEKPLYMKLSSLRDSFDKLGFKASSIQQKLVNCSNLSKDFDKEPKETVKVIRNPLSSCRKKIAKISERISEQLLPLRNGTPDLTCVEVVWEE